MKYMLDTNICIYAIKHKPQAVLDHIMRHDPSSLFISSVTYAELMYGVEKSSAKAKNYLALTLFLSPMEVIPFDSNVAKHYGNIRAELEKKGTPIGSMDTLIAAHARSSDMILVTNNTREFNRVSNLAVENWALENK